MTSSIWVFVPYIILIAVFSVGLAFMFDTLSDRLPWKRKALYSAVLAAGIPTIAIIVIVSVESGFEIETAIVATVLLALGAILTATIAYPTSYFFLKKRGIDSTQDEDI